MGYVSKDIAVITEPSEVSLAGSHNFAVFESLPGNSSPLIINIEVLLNNTWANVERESVIHITERDGTAHIFTGTLDEAHVGVGVYFISALPSDTAENLRLCMLGDEWVRNHFDITLPMAWSGTNPVNGNVLRFASRGTGRTFNVTLKAVNDPAGVAIKLLPQTPVSVTGDSIRGDETSVTMELDVYTGASLNMGDDDAPVEDWQIGRYVTTLSKTYTGRSVWFDLNALFATFNDFTPPSSGFGWSWSEMKNYRFAARVRGINSGVFFWSGLLWVINGYGRPTAPDNMGEYVYDMSAFKFLTSKPRTRYIYGQREYLSFLRRDTERSLPEAINFDVSVEMCAYSQGNRLLGSLQTLNTGRLNLRTLNTIALDLDGIIDIYDNISHITVQLLQNGTGVSNIIEYQVVTDCGAPSFPVVFLNRFGGWDTFNFIASPESDVKPRYDNSRSTVTPAFQTYDAVEEASNVELNDTYTITGAVVPDDVAEWLKQLPTSKVIYTSERRRIVIDEFTLRVEAGSPDRNTPHMKFRYSDKFRND